MKNKCFSFSGVTLYCFFISGATFSLFPNNTLTISSTFYISVATFSTLFQHFFQLFSTILTHVYNRWRFFTLSVTFWHFSHTFWHFFIRSGVGASERRGVLYFFCFSEIILFPQFELCCSFEISIESNSFVKSLNPCLLV